VLEEYDALIKRSLHKHVLPDLDKLESQIYALISQQDQDIDALSTALHLTSQQVTMKLSLLELKKIIKKDISGKYILL
jgi:predicted Rossmann fold nucleotide-binding protein DprA/Smf involved in DNA uptake